MAVRASDVGASRLPRWPARLARLIFFDLPRPDRGGIIAPLNYVGSFILAVGRATILGCAILVPTIIIGGPHALEGSVGRLWASLAFVLFEELARLHYAQQAKRPVIALVVFLILIQAVETVAYLNQAIANGAYQDGGMNAYLLSRLPATCVHITATILLAIGFMRRRALAPIFIGVVIAHIAFDFWAPQVVTAITGIDHVGAAAEKGH